MVTDVLTRRIELPAAVVGALAAELPAGTHGSPLTSLLHLADSVGAGWPQTLAECGLAEDGELVPWLARAISVLQWPEAVVRTRDTVASSPATHVVAADTFVSYGQANGVCVIGHPTGRDAFVDELVRLCTTLAERIGEPPVLQLTRWTLQAVDIVLGTDRTRAATQAALATLTSDPDGPESITEVMLADGLLTESGASFLPGPALEGWHDAFDTHNRLELQRLDLAEGPKAARVRTMVFIGALGSRCLIVPLGGDDILLVRPTTQEATVLIDAFLTPCPPVVAEDEFAAVTDAWRASADALLAARP